ncbi:DUF1761 domain-containing protein [Streptomyces sp. KR80]|uniref:DUF1761 domain-containing protein n=1 Tax=Streptomyces sp. KR80 TaxID=3457426 RepID=UPI003FD2627A
MPNINYLAVLVAAVAAFVASGVWYAVFGSSMVRLQGAWRGAAPPEKPEAWRFAVFFVVMLVLSVVIAVMIDLTGVTGVAEPIGLGVLLWVGFVLTQWVNSIAGEDVPVGLAAIHGGDWLLHVVIIAAIVGVWS